MEESVTVEPGHKVVAPPADMTGVEIVLTVTICGAEVAEQPAEFVTETLYDPDELTVIFCVVAPLFHKYVFPFPADADKTTDPP